MAEDTEVNKSSENVDKPKKEFMMNVGMRRVRGRLDSLSVTLPRSWVTDLDLKPVGKCWLKLEVNSTKQLILTALDIVDNAEKPKRVRKPKPVQQVEQQQPQYEEPQEQMQEQEQEYNNSSEY